MLKTNYFFSSLQLQNRLFRIRPHSNPRWPVVTNAGSNADNRRNQ